jgi:hypothetical protein
MSIAGELARFVVGTGVGDLPPLALERARMVIASTVASAAMGADIVSARIIRELARERGGAEEASLWFDGGRRLPVADAARVNAVMSDAAASDDSDLRSIAHIGTIVSTTAIAMAERTGAGGRDVLSAMVLGYEIAGRVDEALTPGRGERGFHGSISTIFGGAVAAGTLLGLTQAQMTQAIALGATSIGGLMVAANTSVAREYHAGLSAMLGIHAAFAAHKGLVAEENVLEMPRGFFSAYGGDHLEDVTKDLGTEWDITTNMAVKLVPGGHPHHAAAEAAANAAIAGNVDPADVGRHRALLREVPYAARTQASDRPDWPRAQPRLLHRGGGGGEGLWLDPCLAGQGHRPGDRRAHRQDHRGPESAAVPGPVPAPPRRDGHDHAEGRAGSSPITWIFHAGPPRAESNGPTWTPSTAGWCRSPAWRLRASRPASR